MPCSGTNKLIFSKHKRLIKKMKIIKDIEEIKQPFNNAAITIGNFDGVHLGHQILFHTVIEKADALGGTSVGMTFEPHPLRVLKKKDRPPLITLYEQKRELISSTGIDVLITVPFTPAFANLTATQFVEDILVNRIGMKAIVVGKDYSFGKNREGNLDFLKSIAKRLDFQVIVPDWIKALSDTAGRISSTRVRELVTDGDIVRAQKQLGRHYQIRGTVGKGRDRGGKLVGFPTANIKLQDELCPKTGVYAVTVKCGNQLYKGVANIGYSPTFDDHQFTVEVHLLDFNKNIYGEKLFVNFVQRIRNEMKFSNISELSEQIKKDIVNAREILCL